MKSRENSVRHLGNFYTVIAGLAISTAVLNIIDAQGKLLDVRVSELFLIASFVATLLPFYHGAMRHLDASYVDAKDAGPKGGALLADFLILFIGACFFLALAVKIKEPVGYTFILTGLLLLDAIWAFCATFFSEHGAEASWAKVNFVTVLVLFAFLYWKGQFESPPLSVDAYTFSLAIFVISIARTTFDYWSAWDYYYPREG
jgi:hypothetical protein